MGEKRLKRAWTPRDILNKEYQLLEWAGAWVDAFARPEAKGLWFIWGESGAGKGSFILILLIELSRYFKVIVNDLEEGDAHTVRKAFERYGVSKVKTGRLFWVDEDMETFSYRMSKHKSPHVMVINSFQYTRMSFNKFYEFKKKHKNKLIIVISQAEGKHPMGLAAKRVKYDAALKIFIEGFLAVSKGRYIGKKGTFPIWDEGMKDYHGTEKKND